MIIQSLVDLYERTPDLAPVGYERRAIHIAVDLDLDGNLLGVDDVRVPIQRIIKKRGKEEIFTDRRAPEMLVPYWPANRTSGVVPSFLTDPAPYVLGCGDKKRLEEKFSAWKTYHIENLSTATDPRLLALRKWLTNWSVAKASALKLPEIDTVNVCIRVDGRYLHDLDEAREIWLGILTKTLSPGICVVTGSAQGFVQNHQAIRGVRASKEDKPKIAKLMSYDGEVSGHFGLQGMETAPLSLNASHAYVTALDHLISRRQRAFIGGCTVVFWSDAAQAEATDFDDAIAALLTGTVAVNDETEAKRIKNALDALNQGRLPSSLAPETPYHILAIQPGTGRHTIKWHLRSTLGEIAEHVCAHQSVLGIPGLNRSLSITEIVNCSFREGADQSPALPLELTRSVFTGSRYPESLGALIVGRLAVHDDLTPERAATLRAWLARNHARNIDMSEHKTTPYLLGRILALVEQMQLAGDSGVAVTIRQRMWGPMTTRPQQALGEVLRRAGYYRPRVAREKGGGLAHHIDSLIAETVASIPSVPTSMSNADRAEFALGFYAAMAERRSKKDA